MQNFRSMGAMKLFYGHLKIAIFSKKPEHPLGKPPENFSEKANMPHPLGTKEVRNFEAWGRKIVLKPHPQGNYFQKSSKKQNKRHKI